MPTAQVPHRQAGLSKVIVLVIVLLSLLVASGSVLALYFAGVFGKAAPPVAGAAVEVAAEPKGPTMYVPLEPPLVVNFERNGRMGFLQVTMQAMTREQTAQQGISQHMPVIRNNLLMLISSKTYADVSSREGKELLRQEALSELNAVLEQQQVKGRAEDLYFTGFVMQ